MTGTDTVLTVEPRSPGKGVSGKLRKDRKIPAVIYGPKMENQNCLIDELFVVRHSGSRHESSIFQTKSDEKNLNSLKVMIKNIDNHPLTTRPVHVDLYALDMSAKIRVHVTFDFEGTPIGVKTGGGVLQTNLREVEIECNPTEIPESIIVNVEGLDLNESLHVSDITFAAGITPMTSGDRTICSVAVPKDEPAETALDGAAEGAAAASVPVVGEKKD